MIRRPAWRSCLVAALLISSGWAQAQNTRADAPSASPLADRVVPLEATVNGKATGVWPFVERAGQLYAAKDALEEWRVLVPPGVAAITVRGQDYWPLKEIPGFTLRVNLATQAVDLSFAPEAFATTQLTRSLPRPTPSPVLPSVFLNYDLNFQATRSAGDRTRNDLGALLELGASHRWGVLTHSHVGRAIVSGAPSWVRLETTFTRHLPEHTLTLRVGDAATRAGLWGNSVYFGGIQVGSNYGLVPGFLTQPLPVIGGVSAAPSTVQLYVNDVLRKVSEVPAGPFVIDNLSGLAGAGEARLVVRDILGREVVIVQRFFTSGQLLAPGLSDWSSEAGWLRENLGVANANYGSRFLSGTYRRGMTNGLTLEGRAELTRSARTVGAGGITALPLELLARGAVAASQHETAGTGHKWMAGFERQWATTSALLQAQGASRQYAEIGRRPGGFGARLEWAANVATTLGRRGDRLGVSFVGTQRYDAPAVRTLSANYTVPLPGKAALTITASRAFGSASGTLIGANLIVPLEQQRQMQASATSHRGVHDFYASVSQSSLRELDFGWRVLGGRFQNERHSEAGVYYGGRYGRVFGDIAASASQTSLRAGVTGGLVAAAGRTFLAQRVDQSFAVVEVKGVPDVGVGLGSTVTTRTDAEGIALVPYLAPFQTNQIRLNAQDLPMSVEIGSLEQTAVPVWRSAVKVEFPVRSGRAALVRLVFDDGEPAAAGGVVRIDGDPEEFYVARRGEVYVTGLQSRNRLTLRWNGQTCGFDLALPPPAGDEIAKVGPVRCEGIKR